MKAAGLVGRHPRPGGAPLCGVRSPVNAPNLIGRDFTAARPNQYWCGDITYIKMWEGWCCLATVIDCTRGGWWVVFHSDRGTQYTSKEFVKFCKKNRISRSLGRTGICYDNAVEESFSATYKETFTWIESYYNRRRRHSTLNNFAPHEY